MDHGLSTNQLPIYTIQKEIIDALTSNNRLIIHAPTGSGKSTQVPQYIADQVITKEKRVIVLQPRRIAARLLAKHIAETRHTSLGSEVGYHVRLENESCENTRILFCTEGILMQRLLRKDSLNETGAIILDEFHERHIETDLCLSLALELQKATRPDLKIIVMSATLDTNFLLNYLNPCPLLKTEGRTFPVNIIYNQPKPYETLWDSVAMAIENNKTSFNEGSALVFMPGSYEIRKTIEAMQKRSYFHQFELLPLHGSLSKAEQDNAVRSGERKIIISTNVAETSLTIPGVTLVIDSGVAKISRFDVRRGVNTLFTEPVSKSSAQQRAGRAGRTAPGTCIRLWSEFSHENRPQNEVPEIHRIDLSEVFLGLMASGYSLTNKFPWFDTPTDIAIDKALSTLKNLDAIDSQGSLTAIGQKMAQYNMHPRFARILTEAQSNNCFSLTCIIAAIAQTSGLLSTTTDEVIKNEREHQFGNHTSDLIFELNAWMWAGKRQFKSSECKTLGINSNTARQVAQLALQIIHNSGISPSLKKEKLPESISYEEENALRKSIFEGFKDLLAVRHRTNSPTCQLAHNKSGQLHRDSVVKDSNLMVVTESEEIKTPTGIQLSLRKVTAIEESWLQNITSAEMIKTTETKFDTNLQKVIQSTNWIWNGLVLKRDTKDSNNPEEIALFMTKAILDKNIPFPQWNEDVEHFIRRVNFASKHCPHYGIPPIDEDAIEFIIQQAIYGCKSSKEIAKCTIWQSLNGWFSYEQLSAVNLAAPETIELPHRHKPVKLRYDDKGDVILSETIQALYDCPLPITVAEGKVSVIFELLAPSRRPVQITRDLDYFWKNSYHQIKKELKGRYPKHEWR
jgi:ATP-dependent helicase HrpB